VRASLSISSRTDKFDTRVEMSLEMDDIGLEEMELR
jgi:hypothetical protein